MRHLRRTLAFAALGLSFALAATAQDDTKFVSDTIRSNLAEIELGELAQQRGERDDVREFGKTLVADHTRGLEKSTELAKALDVTPPTEPTAEAQNAYEMMARMSGDEFDRHFAQHMVMAHAQNVAEYKKQSEDGSNGRIADFAKEALPTLQRHLQTAQQIDDELKAR